MGGICGAGTAGDKANARPAGHLTDRLGHHAGAALLPTDCDREIAVVEGVENRKIALARHAKDVAYAMNAQLVDQDFGGTAPNCPYRASASLFTRTAAHCPWSAANERDKTYHPTGQERNPHMIDNGNCRGNP